MNGQTERVSIMGRHCIATKTCRLTGTKVKVYRCHEWDEFVVRLYHPVHGLQAESDYHTDDKQDALETAKTMIND